MNSSTPIFGKLLDQLLSTLGDQKGLFAEATRIEEEKNQAILTRDGKNLEKLTRQEEKILHQLDEKEQQRFELLARLASEAKKEQPEKLASILDWPEVPGETRARLDKEAGELVDVIFKMQSLSRLNQSMIEDNNEMFRVVIDSLKAETEFGYHESAADKNIHKRKKPIFVDVGC